MSMAPSRLAFAGGAGLLLLAGCVGPWTRPQTGTVTSIRSTRADAVAPDFTFVDPKGQIHNLSTFYGDATVLALIEQPCSRERMPLAIGAAKARPHVTVIEITSPQGGCSLHDQCILVRGDRARSLISLCDGTGRVREWFGVSTQDSVFLLNRFGIVIDRGGLRDLERLVDRAGALADEVELHRTTLHQW